MFGNKSDKQARLERAVTVIRERGEISQADLARELGTRRDLIHRDLAMLHDQGVLLCEDERGRLSLLERWFGKRG
jgi:DeoR/GlpR family transcriptional regulator of sugar metabolism